MDRIVIDASQNFKMGSPRAYDEVAGESSVEKFPLKSGANSDENTLAYAWQGWAKTTYRAQLSGYLYDQKVRAVNPSTGQRYTPSTPGMDLGDPAWMLDADEQRTAKSLLAEGSFTIWPSFKTPARPREIPPVLRLLSPLTEIRISEEFGGMRSESARTAEHYISDLERIMHRQSEGLFTVAEAAQVMADSISGKTGADWARDMRAAHNAGGLAIRDSSSRIPFKPARPADNAVIPQAWTAKQETARDFSDLVKGADLDAWLMATAGYGFPCADQSSPAAPETQVLPRKAWIVKAPVRDDGLAQPIYRVLKAACDRGGPRPSARAVMDAFANEEPREIVKVLDDSVDFYDTKGNVKTATIEKIRRRIGKMTA